MRVMLSIAVAAISLAGCNRPVSIDGGSEAHGRYASAGIYPVGRMWTQVVGAPAPKDSSAAKPADDEQIIVVLDSRTGELRQCGNISGFCVGMNPWAKPVGASAPLAVAKHAGQLEAEAEAKSKANFAAASKPR